MDKLTKEAQDHGEIFESLAFFQKALPAFSGHLDDFDKFLNEYLIAHFEFEENEIFPVMLEKDNSEVKELIEELIDDHKKILTIVDQFKGLLPKYKIQSTEVVYNDLMELNKTIIKKTMEHARKEDSKLFPILKTYEIDLK